MVFDRLAHAVTLSWGWRRVLYSVMAGAFGALALAPFGVFPALFLSFVPLVWLLDGTASAGTFGALRQAALLGWFFGFGYFVAGLWWLGMAFLVEPDQFALLLPLGVLGLPAVLAVFPAFGLALARLLWSPGPSRIVALAVGLSASEWLRGSILTGFPWNSWGMALGGHIVLAQVASVVGLYGLTFLAILVCAAPATLWMGRARRRWLPSALASVLLAGLAGGGALRLALGEVAPVKGVTLRVVQPDIPQDDRFRPENKQEIMKRYLTLSDRATSPARSGVGDVTHLIWPESAFPFILAREPAALAQIATLLPKGVTLVTGAARLADPLPGENAKRYYNAMQVVSHDGTIIASADKVHLVPFGEYLPLNEWLTGLGLRQFVTIPGGFEAGSRRTILPVPGLPPVAPLICYEVIFPGEVRPEDGEPGVMINLTNDAWFGLTPGPYQHLAQARLRSIEEGLPLVRAANNGISAVVDPYGRIIASLPLGTVGVMDSNLPDKLQSTVFARFGHWPFAALLALGTLFAVLGRRTN